MLHFCVAGLITSVTLSSLIILFETIALTPLFILISSVVSLIFIVLKECIDSNWSIKSPTFDKKDILFGLGGTLLVDVIAFIAFVL